MEKSLPPCQYCGCNEASTWIVENEHSDNEIWTCGLCRNTIEDLKRFLKFENAKKFVEGLLHHA